MNDLLLGFRKHLQLSEIHFITDCLANTEAEVEALLYLLIDPNTVDSVLDHPKLFETVLNSPEALHISSRLYFYLITRHSLKDSGLDDADLADYVAAVLNSHLHKADNPQNSIFYIIDWLNELEKSPKEQHFKLYVMVGNYLLYLTGIFPQSIHERTRRRGAPSLDFYEDVARHSFRAASQQIEENTQTPDWLYKRLAENFSELRCALNDASGRLLHLDPLLPPAMLK